MSSILCSSLHLDGWRPRRRDGLTFLHPQLGVQMEGAEGGKGAGRSNAGPHAPWLASSEREVVEPRQTRWGQA